MPEEETKTQIGDYTTTSEDKRLLEIILEWGKSIDPKLIAEEINPRRSSNANNERDSFTEISPILKLQTRLIGAGGGGAANLPGGPGFIAGMGGEESSFTCTPVQQNSPTALEDEDNSKTITTEFPAQREESVKPMIPVLKLANVGPLDQMVESELESLIYDSGSYHFGNDPQSVASSPSNSPLFSAFRIQNLLMKRSNQSMNNRDTSLSSHGNNSPSNAGSPAAVERSLVASKSKSLVSLLQQALPVNFGGVAAELSGQGDPSADSDQSGAAAFPPIDFFTGPGGETSDPHSNIHIGNCKVLFDLFLSCIHELIDFKMKEEGYFLEETVAKSQQKEQNEEVKSAGSPDYIPLRITEDDSVKGTIFDDAFESFEDEDEFDEDGGINSVDGGPVVDLDSLVDNLTLTAECILFHGSKSINVQTNHPNSSSSTSQWNAYSPAKLFTSKAANRRDVWTFLEQVPDQKGVSPALKNMFSNIKQLPGLKTLHGRVQAALRMSLMEKTFSELFSLIILSEAMNHSDYYESWSFIKSDYAKMISGMLLFLDQIQFNLFVKGEELERIATPIHANPIEDVFSYVNMILGGSLEVQTPIDLSPTENNVPMSPGPNAASTSSINHLKRLLGTANQQINYLEETNKTQASKLKQLKKSQITMEKENKALKEQLQKALDLICTHELANASLQAQISREYQKHEEEYNILREQLSMSKLKQEQERSLTQQMAEAMQRTVETEQRLRQQVETELNLLRRRLAKEEEIVKELKKQLDGASKAV